MRTMDLLSREDLQYLIGRQDRFCVSLFLPTPREGKEVAAGRIQCKDLLREAEERLRSAGLAKSDAGELLAPARQLTRHGEFWRYQSDGLALFLTHGFFRYFRVPLKLAPFVAVTDRFELTPLLPLWTSEERFYLLALSRKRTRFFEGTRYAISQVNLTALPTSLAETLETSVDVSHRQQHTLKPGLPEDELLYFRRIDATLRRSIRDQRTPLILAAVEEAISDYRKVNQYATLLEEAVIGNPDRLSAGQLQQKAAPLAQAFYERARRHAILLYKERNDPARTSHELAQILPAAYQGRIFHLFVAAGAEIWGRFAPEEGTVAVHQQAERGDQELLNLAVIQTILHGGTVHSLAPAEVPDGGPVAAVFRY